MRSVFLPAFGGLRVWHVAALSVPLAVSLLPSSDAAAALPSYVPSAAIVAPAQSASKITEPTQPKRVELAGRKNGDDSFDPYGKDDPTSKKWGAAAGLLGNRYGGIRTGGGDGKNAGRRDGRGSDRDDREPRAPRGDDSGKN